MRWTKFRPPAPVSQAVRAFQQHPEAGMVYADGLKIDGFGSGCIQCRITLDDDKELPVLRYIIVRKAVEPALSLEYLLRLTDKFAANRIKNGFHQLSVV